MDKLRKLFGGDKSKGDSSAPAKPPAGSAGVGSGDIVQNPNNVVLHTTLGDITVQLFTQQTPRTCANFATLAKTGKYDNVIFHRIIKGFMIQGGDPTGTGRGGRSIYGEKFEDEIVPSLKHEGKGILSMANSGPSTNGSQFFITLAPTPHLNGKHTVFGKVTDGMDVVDKLGSVATDKGDRPKSEVKIVSCDVD
ncbi:hypothetical protein PRZ48_009394 [Zasmidium cellare]|uniref:Peptidyl-prolyl cis-trans isomerase n=1 Tax=Zasmidium cellare TaxID=395010 RepID=A0ABR0EC01_ZASCE|nr:hypothetical protein PRZ48_009394 [Zasmidium cellare]